MQFFGRKFRLWDFKVSHDQLLLRSAKDNQHRENIDVAFVGVEYLELPTRLEELKIREGGDAEHRKTEELFGKRIAKGRVFVIESNDHCYIVVAAAMKVIENELDFFESSLEVF